MHVTVILDRESTPAQLKALSNLCLALAGEQPSKRDVIEYEVRIDTKQAQEDLRKFSDAVGASQLTVAIDTELHEAGPLIADLPPPGTFTQAELDANDPPFVPAAGASTTNAPPVNPALTSGSVSALDADGLPWDERIHSSNRKLASNGKWWAKRGVDDQLRLKVEAELRAVIQIEAQTGLTGDAAKVVATNSETMTPPPPPPPPPARTDPPFPLFVKALNLHNNDKTKTRIETIPINEAIAAMGITPAVLPTMAKQENWGRLGELAQMIGLEGVA